MAVSLGLIAVPVFFLAIFTYFAAKYLRIVFLISKFPGPPALPIIGNITRYKYKPRESFVDMQTNLSKYRKECNGLMRWWTGPYPALFVYSAQHMEELLTASREHTKKGQTYKMMEPWLGLGLLTSSGEKWFHRRKMLTPAFHFSILQNFMEVFNEQSSILVNNLEKYADKPSSVNIFPLLTYCVLDIICDTAMGKHINAQGDSQNEYVKAVLRMSHLIMTRFKKPWLWPDWIFFRTQIGQEHDKLLGILHDVTNKIIKERLQDTPRQLNGIGKQADVVGRRKRIAFLDLLLQMHRENEKFTLKDIREEVDTFMFEGHDTTAAAAVWAVVMLGLHPGVQTRLHEELDQVFGASDRPVTSDDLLKLPYLTSVIKETIRIMPSVAAVTRELNHDIILDGKVVPKETTLALHMYALHQDPEHFPNPEQFDPDRFLPENIAKRHPFAYIPFSAGPRNCIGQKFAMMEEKVIIANLFRKYSIKSVHTLEETCPTSQLIMRPVDGNIPVTLTSRK